jgi:hypothetical protein
MSFTVTTERGEGPVAVTHHTCYDDIRKVAESRTPTKAIADTFQVPTAHGNIRVTIEVHMYREIQR